MKRILSTSLAGVGLALLAALGGAQIERLDLGQMVAGPDKPGGGGLRATQLVGIDHPTDGPELYFTHLKVEGVSLRDGKPVATTVSFPGGFLTPEQGVHNSEAPSADEVKVGNEVVVFYKWSDNMGGELASNALYASHGGIYQVAKSRKGEVALGKGEGYAIAANVTVSDLKSQIGALLK
jgi:hypothetical protein